MTDQNEPEICIVNDVKYRILYPHDDQTIEPYYKCECSQIIKKEKNLFTHTLTKSHETNLKNKFYFAPPNRTFLTPSL